MSKHQQIVDNLNDVTIGQTFGSTEWRDQLIQKETPPLKVLHNISEPPEQRIFWFG